MSDQLLAGISDSKLSEIIQMSDANINMMVIFKKWTAAICSESHKLCLNTGIIISARLFETFAVSVRRQQKYPVNKFSKRALFALPPNTHTCTVCTPPYLHTPEGAFTSGFCAWKVTKMQFWHPKGVGEGFDYFK